MVNEFLKYGGSEARNNLLKIMNMIFEKREVLNDLRKTLLKPLYKKGDKSECRNCRGVSLVSVGSKLLSNQMFLRVSATIEPDRSLLQLVTTNCLIGTGPQLVIRKELKRDGQNTFRMC